jgi:hypothetical protein
LLDFRFSKCKIVYMEINIEQLKSRLVPVSLEKALQMSKKLWGRIEWAFIDELGFTQHMSREQISMVYSKVNSGV